MEAKEDERVEEMTGTEGPTGNAANSREALENVRDWLVRANNGPLDALATSQCIITARSVNDPAKSVIRDNKFFIDEINAALNDPPRNCDVGTAEEQATRFDAFCRRFPSCSVCPVHALWNFEATRKPSCALYWAQMPFEEGGTEAARQDCLPTERPQQNQQGGGEA